MPLNRPQARRRLDPRSSRRLHSIRLRMGKLRRRESASSSHKTTSMDEDRPMNMEETPSLARRPPKILARRPPSRLMHHRQLQTSSTRDEQSSRQRSLHLLPHPSLPLPLPLPPPLPIRRHPQLSLNLSCRPVKRWTNPLDPQSRADSHRAQAPSL